VTHRNFRIFWFGQTVSLMGSWMQQMALGWLALELSNNAFVVGLVVAAGSMPILLLSLPAGVLVDRGNKLRIVTAAQALLSLPAAALWWFTWSGNVTVGWLIGLATLSGIVGAIEIPARQALMIDLVGREDLRDAIALNSSGFNLARIVGPGIGAFIVANFGIAWCFGVNAISYVMVLGGLALVRLPPWSPPMLQGRPFQVLLDGLVYALRERRVRGLLELVAVFSVLGTPYIALMPVLARERLGLDASGYGLMLSVLGIGGLTGALTLAAAGPYLRRGQLLTRAALAFAALLMVLSVVRQPVLAYPVLFATGFLMIVNNATANGLLQTIVPDEYRGRLMSIYSLIVIGLPQVLGALVGGAVARAVGVEWAIGGAAVAMLGLGVWLFRRYPEVRDL
jgi:MFS family permease